MKQMDKNSILNFFDSCAETWDAEMIKSDEIINLILDKSEVKKDTRVLDIACGTGVLFDYYLSRGAKVTGMDLSPEMVKICKSKFPEIPVICADADTYPFREKFDVCIIYNAFPHFPDPELTVSNLITAIKENGRLTIAHGMSRERINAHHQGKASPYSRPLPEINELNKLLSANFQVDTLVSDNEKYIISGKLK